MERGLAFAQTEIPRNSQEQVSKANKPANVANLVGITDDGGREKERKNEVRATQAKNKSLPCCPARPFSKNTIGVAPLPFSEHNNAIVCSQPRNQTSIFPFGKQH